MGKPSSTGTNSRSMLMQKEEKTAGIKKKKKATWMAKLEWQHKLLNSSSRGAKTSKEAPEQRCHWSSLGDRWSPNATQPGLSMLCTHRHTPGNRRAPHWCQRVTRWPICLDPSAQRDAQLAVPTDRWPSPAQVPWQAGGQAGASPRRGSNSRFSLVSLCYYPEKGPLSAQRT